MLDERTVRKHLRQVQDSLQRLEAERDALLTMMKGLEAWLRLHTPDRNGATPALVPIAVDPNLILPSKERVSLRATVLKVVRDARGEPLHVSEIWKRAQVLGATTNASRPISAVDFALHGLSKKEPVERAGGGKWRWSALTTEIGGKRADLVMPKRLK